MVFRYGSPSRLMQIACGVHPVHSNNLSNCMYLPLFLNPSIIYSVWFKNYTTLCAVPLLLVNAFLHETLILSSTSQVPSQVWLTPLQSLSPSPQVGERSPPLDSYQLPVCITTLTFVTCFSAPLRGVSAPLANIFFLQKQQSVIIITKYGTHRKTHKKEIPLFLGHQ